MSGVVFSMLRSAARRTLPVSIRRYLYRVYFWLDGRLKWLLTKPSRRRPLSLVRFEPLQKPGMFSSGPIIMVNSALASGGVERQIVNTLLGIGRGGSKFGLLCLHLGEEPDLEFFKPALADFTGFVRNAMTAAEARHLIGKSLSESELKRVERLVGWMPEFVREEIIRLTGECISLKPSVIHGWQDSSGIVATYAAKIAGVPRIMISTRNVRPTNFAWYHPFMYLAHLELVRCKEIILINNSEAGAIDYARWLKISPSRFVVKRNGIDTAMACRPDPQAVAHLRARLGILPGGPVIGSIFRFNAEKRPLLWIEAASEVAKRRPDCQFIIFGLGPLQGAAISLAERRGIADRFHSPGTEDAATALALFDVFLLTSKFEGTPNVVLEASLLGVPVVATDAGGTREAINEGVTGYVVESADPLVIASRIIQVLDDEDWRARVKEEGPIFVERRFGLNRMVAETLVLYGLPPE